ncbi:MAG: VapC toxin family PIN domain ribonuclease [Vicinamibacterales bacterium]|jgi:hypothetical protein|nr:VapC toxin family PIN domain ribonuclease [Vicinamibacterales bacterium]
MSRPALLDVNILVALFDPDHVHHDLAHDWFADNRRHGWATCPVTENGFVRVLSNPAFGSAVARAPELFGRLGKFCRGKDHQFWPDAVTLRDETRFRQTMLSGHRQLTDIYLLGLARAQSGRLATFDRTIPVKAVVGATTKTLAVIEPLD